MAAFDLKDLSLNHQYRAETHNAYEVLTGSIPAQ